MAASWRVRLLCRLGWHRWSLWTEPEKHNFVRVQYGNVIDLLITSQTRRCNDCRLSQIRQREVLG